MRNSVPFPLPGPLQFGRIRTTVTSNLSSDEIDIDPAMLEKIIPPKFPPLGVIVCLANEVFPECEAIMVL